jgi:hypothetical protein
MDRRRLATRRDGTRPPTRLPVRETRGSTVSEFVLLFACVACGRRAAACPDCVNTVRIDPHTGLPIDVAVVDGQLVTVEPSEQAHERSRTQPVCDDCVHRRNARHPDRDARMTAADRHRRGDL